MVVDVEDDGPGRGRGGARPALRAAHHHQGARQRPGAGAREARRRAARRLRRPRAPPRRRDPVHPPPPGAPDPCAATSSSTTTWSSPRTWSRSRATAAATARWRPSGAEAHRAGAPAPASTRSSPTCACRGWGAPRWSTRSGASTRGSPPWSSPPTPRTPTWRRPGARGCSRCSPSRRPSTGCWPCSGRPAGTDVLAVLEDDPALLDNLTEALRLRGFAAVTASLRPRHRPARAGAPLRRAGRPAPARRPGRRGRSAASRRASPGSPSSPSPPSRPPRPPTARAIFRKPFDTAALLDVVERSTPKGHTPREPPSPARRSRVLVVDDNAALAENLRDILEDAGFAVRAGGILRRGPRRRRAAGSTSRSSTWRCRTATARSWRRSSRMARPTARWCSSPATPPWSRRSTRCGPAPAPTSRSRSTRPSWS